MKQLSHLTNPSPDPKICMVTTTGHTVIDRINICALTLLEHDRLQIHLDSGTIFTTQCEAAIESLWYCAYWGIYNAEEE